LFSPTDAIGEDDVELESAADKAALLLPARIPLKLQQVNDGNEVSKKNNPSSDCFHQI
jgi:hypothetical protein